MNKNKENLLVAIFNQLYYFMESQNWLGACHASSAVLYCLCKVIGVNAVPCIGEVKSSGIYFDHSWIEIENKVYDIAISLPLIEKCAKGPIFKSIDLSSMKLTDIEYGVNYNGLDDYSINIKNESLYEYMNSSPDIDLFKLVDSILNIYNIKYDFPNLIKDLKLIFWKEIK